MKNIVVYIISALILGAVLLIYIKDLSSYGISLPYALAFVIAIILLITIAGFIIRSLYKKIQNKDKGDGL